MIFTSFFITGLLLLILQTSLFPDFPDWFGQPDLLFILIAYCALRLTFYSGLFLVFLLGMTLDIFSGFYMGLHTVAYLLLFFILQGVSRQLDLEYITHQPVICAMGYLLTNGLVFLAASILANGTAFSWSWPPILLGTIMVAVFAVPFTQLFDGIALLATSHKSRHHHSNLFDGTQ